MIEHSLPHWIGIMTDTVFPLLIAYFMISKGYYRYAVITLGLAIFYFFLKTFDLAGLYPVFLWFFFNFSIWGLLLLVFYKSAKKDELLEEKDEIIKKMAEEIKLHIQEIKSLLAKK